MDGAKCLWLLRRPWPRQAANIGAWQFALEGVGFLSVATNCALVATHSTVVADALQGVVRARTPTRTHALTDAHARAHRRARTHPRARARADWPPAASLLLFLALEHALFALKATLAVAIPDVPDEVARHRAAVAGCLRGVRDATAEAARRSAPSSAVYRAALEAEVASLRQERQQLRKALAQGREDARSAATLTCVRRTRGPLITTSRRGPRRAVASLVGAATRSALGPQRS